MTKSTITRERLQEIINLACKTCSDGSIIYPKAYSTVNSKEIVELASMALAAMDSEPVAWTWHYREQWHVTSDKGRAAFVAIDGDVAVLPLYRHAQQPVVPDESYQQLSELYHAQEKRLFKIARRIKGPAFDKYSHTPSQAIDVLEGAIFGEDDACRAAMLAAAQQEVK